MSELKTEFCIIGKEKDSFIESYVGEPLTPSDQHEYFFIVVELLHKFLEGDTIAEAISETFRKAFYKSELTDDYSRFEEALKEVNNLTKQLEEQEGLVLKNVNISITALIGNELYLSQSNDSEIYLIRKGYVSVISDGLSDGYTKAGEDLFTNVSSGTLEAGDHILLSSGRILRYITKNELGRKFYGARLPEVLLELRDDLNSEVLGRLGILAYEYKHSVNEEELIVFPESTSAKSETRAVKSNNNKGLITKLKSKATNLVDFFNFIPDEPSKEKELESAEQPMDMAEVETDETQVINYENFVAPLPSAKKEKVKRRNKLNPVLDAMQPLLDYLVDRFSAKTLKIAAGSLSVFIVFAVIFGITRGAQLSQIKEFEDILVSAREQIIEAGNKADKAEAAAILANAEQSLTPALGAKYVRTEANKILAEIKEARFKFDQVTIVEDPQLVADLNNASDGGEINGLLRFTEGVFAYNQSELIEVLIDSFKEPINLIDEGLIIMADVLKESNNGYFIVDNNRLLQFNDGLAKFIDTEDEKLKNADAISSFGSRVYLLDNLENQIWKYNQKRDSLSGAEAYLKNGKLPLSKDLAIDGSIYVLTNNNQIIRYFGGEIDNFRIIDEPLVAPQNPTRIFTDEASSYVYVLDSAENRVMLYFKNVQTDNLEYVKQYFFPTLNGLVDFLVLEDSKKLYVADTHGVYVTELN